MEGPEPKVPLVPVKEVLLEQQDEEIDEVLLFKDELEWLNNIDPIILSGERKVGPVSQGLAGSTHAPNAPGPLKNHRGCKPPIFIDNLELVDFPAYILEQEEPAQLLFLKEVVFPVLPSQLKVVKLTTDPCTPVQYNGLVAARAANKGKQQVVPAIKDDSHYGQLQSEEEEEAKEGEMAAQRFQHVQQNKRLAKEKVNKAKNAAALLHRVHFRPHS
ncbi:hypothetical protein C0992_007880 [Termitomyces sp. T32_za158]|nr:hypothetical protein C0992_007880 [Termitomyces sp. T32_za158]